jgi:hypothetical protein
MKWLIGLETGSDPITLCRLMNIFRRKGANILTLTVASRAGGFSLMALVETPEAEMDHLFHFLRRTDGVRHVTYYRHEPAGAASFVFIDAEASSPGIERFLESFPQAKLIFASQGKYLLEVPADRRARPAATGLGRPEFLPFALVKTSLQARELLRTQVS